MISPTTPSFALPYPSRRQPVLARQMVATSQPLAAQAGLAVLGRGGNAVDAAIATAATLAVVEPTGNGLGSDAFAIVWDGADLHGLNASGRSPAAWGAARFADRQEMPKIGWDSVTVPGAVSAWRDLSERFGKLDFASLLEPAIRYAHDGFAVSPTIARLWKAIGPDLRSQPGYADNYLPGGRAPLPGELFSNRALARTLAAIAETKGEAFYRGAIAQTIADAARRHDAALSAEDLAAHANDWCGTICTDFAGSKLHEIPPNGQGIAALMALGMLENLPFASMEPDSVDSLHFQIEATKLAFADLRRHVADPAHMRVPVEALLDKDYLRDRAALIERDRAQIFGAGAPTVGGTVYLTVADASGMMVSYIQSDYSAFGSGVTIPELGIHLQSRGFGFTLEDGHVNQVGPRKRPFHTIIPGFVMRDDRPFMSFGLMGGPMQAQGHVQMMVRTHIYGQNVQAASDAPRWRFIAGTDLAVEEGLSPATIDELARRGHTISRESPDTSFGFGGAQLIQRLGEGYIGGSDHRKDGMAVGF